MNTAVQVELFQQSLLHLLCLLPHLLILFRLCLKQSVTYGGLHHCQSQEKELHCSLGDPLLNEPSSLVIDLVDLEGDGLEAVLERRVVDFDVIKDSLEGFKVLFMTQVLTIHLIFGNLNSLLNRLVFSGFWGFGGMFILNSTLDPSSRNESRTFHSVNRLLVL